MHEDLSPTPRSRRVAAGEKLAARRRRTRAIRRRVAGMSLATFLAASGAVLIQLVTGHDPALGHSTHTAATAVASRTAQSGSSSSPTTSVARHEDSRSAVTSSSSSRPDSASTGSARSGGRSGSAAAASPSAVTTSAS